MVQSIRVRFFAFHPRYSPEMKAVLTVTFSLCQNASYEIIRARSISTFFTPSKE